jgi:hypothetical protein
MTKRAGLMTRRAMAGDEPMRRISPGRGRLSAG